MQSACAIRIRGIVQGVGFRPFVYRLAQESSLTGWVLNGDHGVEIFLEGPAARVQDFVRDLAAKAPPAAKIAEIEVVPAEPSGLREFTIRDSNHVGRPSVRVSPDLPVCKECLSELFDPKNPRFGFPYINCTNCGPRYTIVTGLPYDRPNTTMKKWPLDEFCATEYRDPANRRFHAQPVACPECGPNYFLQVATDRTFGHGAIKEAVRMLREGCILAVKGLGGYHLACDARNPAAVRNLRERKFRKEKPFAVMARDLETAREIVALSAHSESLLQSTARPIVLAPAKQELAGVAPENRELGVMLPYTPLHHLLFAEGAPSVLVMTSANRSSEPIAYEDDDALHTLTDIADAFLIGERPIARRVDDSVVRAGVFGPAILRRARGYAPGAVATIPTQQPILALGADLKNSISLAVGGQVFASQHIGDLEHLGAFRAFDATISDLLSMYEVPIREVLLVHDMHPQYRSTARTLHLAAANKIAAQHHRAHIASALAEHEMFDTRVIGVSFDGTGYGDDGTIWGGELFVGSVQSGFDRIAHLRPALLPGGDAAADCPAQAAAGFLAQLQDLPDLMKAPFCFPERYSAARELVSKNVRCFTTTSMGRLFDTAAALLGFTREISFEGQAAIWVEQTARRGTLTSKYPFPVDDGDCLDFRPLLQAIVQDRLRGEPVENIARAFQQAIAEGTALAVQSLAARHGVADVVLSGGVFQNELLLEDLKQLFEARGLRAITNHAVPANDGGISLGQAALAAFWGER